MLQCIILLLPVIIFLTGYNPNTQNHKSNPTDDSETLEIAESWPPEPGTEFYRYTKKLPIITKVEVR